MLKLLLVVFLPSGDVVDLGTFEPESCVRALVSLESDRPIATRVTDSMGNTIEIDTRDAVYACTLDGA